MLEALWKGDSFEDALSAPGSPAPGSPGLAGRGEEEAEVLHLYYDIICYTIITYYDKPQVNIMSYAVNLP